MGKYKLIKEYPGSPAVGTIAVYSEGRNIWIDEVDKLPITSNGDKITSYPEFWQKIIEFKYEILSFKSIVGNNIYKKDSQLKNHYCRVDGKNTLSLKYMLANKLMLINSVKRLSDGEVFSVGDKVRCWNGVHKIGSIFVKENDCRFLMIFQSFEELSEAYTLEHIQKTFPVLFTTDDGVEIREGDLYHSVLISNLEYKGVFKAEKINRGKFSNPKSCKTFSSKILAEDYILHNNNCLSIKDLLDINHGNNDIICIKFDTLVEKIKNK